MILDFMNYFFFQNVLQTLPEASVVYSVVQTILSNTSSTQHVNGTFTPAPLTAEYYFSILYLTWKVVVMEVEFSRCLKLALICILLPIVKQNVKFLKFLFLPFLDPGSPVNLVKPLKTISGPFGPLL